MDDLTKTGRQDDSKVNLGQDHERAYWTKKFGVSIDVLRQAVNTVGVSVTAVTKWLKDKKHIS